MEKKHIILLFILILALFLRTYKLSTIPNGFIPDEASIGYNAYNLMIRGTDQWGNRFPVYFKAFGEYKNPIYIYSAVPGVFIFGLNEFSTRLPSAVFGVLMVLLTFLLVEGLWGYEVGLIASFLLSISPWHIILSRIGTEQLSFNFLFLLGLLFLYKGLTNKKYFSYSAIPFALSFYSYATAKLFVPLFLIGFFIVYNKKTLEVQQSFRLSIKKETLIAGIILILLLIPFLVNLIQGESQIRFKKVTIINFDHPFSSLVKFLHNYMLYFSPDFLFFSHSNNLMFIPQKVGLIYLFEIPLILLGLLLFIKRFNKEHKVILIWLLVAPIAASLTEWDNHNIIRNAVILPVFQIIAAYAIYNLIFWVKKRREDSKKTKLAVYAVCLIFLVCSLGNISLFMKEYFVEYPKYSAKYWNYGYRDIINYAKENEKEFDKMIVSMNLDQPFIYLTFYSKVNLVSLTPEFRKFGFCLEENSSKCYKTGYYSDITIKKEFYDKTKKYGYIVKGNELSDKKSVFEVKYPDGSIAMKIID